ncbi:MAG: DUF58 domain-containing protein [Gemmataceae bacterium]
MLTPRGFSLLVLLLLMTGWSFFDRYLLTIAGLRVRGQHTNVSLLLLSLTIGLWFAWEWLLFAIRVRLTLRRLSIDRELRDERGPLDTLWAKQSFRVQVRLKVPGGLALPYVHLEERIPPTAALIDGTPSYQGPLSVGEVIELNYQLKARSAGRVRFEGLQVHLADLQGFFCHSTFLPFLSVHRVLPPLADAEGHVPTIKRHNLLPPPGVHRMRRPGTGSELLDLRDYMPGDPPKTIAWKVSARRDRLMTKEFESEVPVRCTLFVDTSQSMRMGKPGETPLGRLVEIASTVTQASASARDLTGLCLFDEKGSTYVRPARGDRHLVRLINLLADVAVEAPVLEQAPLDDLLPAAYQLAQEVYPELLRPEVNRFPGWLPWLFPQPAWSVRQPRVRDHLYHWFRLWLGSYVLGGFILLGLCVYGVYSLLQTEYRRNFSVLMVVFVLVCLSLLGYARLPLAFFPDLRRRYRWRKQLAALLSVRHGLGPGGLAGLLEDDERMARHLQRFLIEHQVPVELPANLKPPRTGKLDVLNEVLLRAVARGHDNELFVLMVEVLEVTDSLDGLLRAVKVAVARHHRVVVICPWPEGQPVPGADDKDRAPRGPAMEWLTPQQRKLHEFHAMRRRFARLGVPVICTQGNDATKLILERIERLRLIGKMR